MSPRCTLLRSLRVPKNFAWRLEKVGLSNLRRKEELKCLGALPGPGFQTSKSPNIPFGGQFPGVSAATPRCFVFSAASGPVARLATGELTHERLDGGTPRSITRGSSETWPKEGKAAAD